MIELKLEAYGLEAEWISKVKQKLGQPEVMEKVTPVIQGLTQQDLQSRPVIVKKLKQLIPIVGIKLNRRQAEGLIRFIIDQKIDPNNTWHLIKLWNVFKNY